MGICLNNTLGTVWGLLKHSKSAYILIVKVFSCGEASNFNCSFQLKLVLLVFVLYIFLYDDKGCQVNWMLLNISYIHGSRVNYYLLDKATLLLDKKDFHTKTNLFVVDHSSYLCGLVLALLQWVQNHLYSIYKVFQS